MPQVPKHDKPIPDPHTCIRFVKIGTRQPHQNKTPIARRIVRHIKLNTHPSPGTACATARRSSTHKEACLIPINNIYISKHAPIARRILGRVSSKIRNGIVTGLFCRALLYGSFVRLTHRQAHRRAALLEHSQRNRDSGAAI